MKKIKAFFKGVRKEAKKTRWVKKKDLIKYSASTLFLLLFFGLFFELINIAITGLKGLF